MSYQLLHQDCLDWLRAHPANSIHAVCTDPPYGLIEFSPRELEKLRAGRGGIWRLPPNINGSQRAPLPRFTVLTSEQQKALAEFFRLWGMEVLRVIVPGGHVVIAGHPILQHHVQWAMAEAGFEVRGAIIRLYQGFRGGDRPKNAEKEFPDVCVTPKGNYEPWMLFRKPVSEETVAVNSDYRQQSLLYWSDSDWLGAAWPEKISHSPMPMSVMAPTRTSRNQTVANLEKLDDSQNALKPALGDGFSDSSKISCQ